jgi:hypothetical protein
MSAETSAVQTLILYRIAPARAAGAAVRKRFFPVPDFMAELRQPKQLMPELPKGL